MVNGDVKVEVFKHNEILGTLDLFESTNFPLALNFGIKNIINVSETTGTYSKTLNIPATKNNNKVLNNIGFDNAVNFTSLLDNSVECRISLNSNVLIVGGIQVKSITSFDKLTSYSVTILGSNITWGKVFSEEFMCDVPSNFDGGIVHEWTNGLWNEINTVPNNVWCLPVICWGEWKKTKWVGGQNYVKKIDLSEVRPSYFVKNLLNTYFNAAGYTIKSNFFNSDLFEKLIIPTSLDNWTKDNPLGHRDSEVRARFQALLVHDQFPDNLQARWIRRYTSWSGDPDPWQRGIEKLLPFDTEDKDVYGRQKLATHDSTYVSELNESYPMRHGHDYDEGTGNISPAPYHSWTVQKDGDYEIRSEIQCGRLTGSEVYAAVIVFRDLQVNDRPHSLTPTSNLGGYVLGGNQDAMFRAMTQCPITQPTSHDPLILISDVLNDDISQQTITLDVSQQPAGQYTHIHWQTLSLNTGTQPLLAGDEVCIFITNLEANNHLNNVSPENQMCWVLHGKQGEIVGEDQHSRTLKIGNFDDIKNANGGFLPETTFEVDRVGRVAYGDKIQMGTYLPCDIPKIDLVKAVTGMFNLYWDTNELEKSVTVEPYNDFYLGRKQAQDWSGKMDMSKPQTTKFILDDIRKELYFKYAKDSGDGYVDEIEQDLLQEYHSLKVLLADGFIDEIEEVGNPITAPTYMFEEWEFSQSESNLVRIPLIVSEYIEDIAHSQKPEVMETHHMRILSYEGMQPTPGIEGVYQSWCWQNGNNGLSNIYPSASTFHDTDTNFANLDYGDRAIDGLYKTYWKKFINKLSDSPRIKTVYFDLKAGDISQLDLQKPVWITDNAGANGGYWIIHKVIDYKPSTQGTTKVELIQFGDVKDNVKLKLRKQQPTLGKNRNTRIDDKARIKDRGQSYSNEGLVLRGNNDSPSENGNILLGSNLTTQKQNQIILGQYNKKDDDAILVIGGGTSDNDRRNVLVVDSSGAVHLGENGGGSGMVTKDDNGNIIDLYTEDKETVNKVIKG
jgi:hypothetical protein